MQDGGGDDWGQPAGHRGAVLPAAPPVSPPATAVAHTHPFLSPSVLSSAPAASAVTFSPVFWTGERTERERARHALSVQRARQPLRRPSHRRPPLQRPITQLLSNSACEPGALRFARPAAARALSRSAWLIPAAAGVVAASPPPDAMLTGVIPRAERVLCKRVQLGSLGWGVRGRGLGLTTKQISPPPCACAALPTAPCLGCRCVPTHVSPQTGPARAPHTHWVRGFLLRHPNQAGRVRLQHRHALMGAKRPTSAAAAPGSPPALRSSACRRVASPAKGNSAA